MLTSKNLKCFISNPPHINPSFVKDILRPLDLEVYDGYDFPLGESIIDSITERIKKADFAIIIVAGNDPQAYYHLGLCSGMNKPVLLLVDKNTESPYFVQSYLHFATEMRETKLLETTITQFVSETTSRKYNQRKRSKKETNSSINQKTAQKYLLRIQEVRHTATGLQIQTMVAQFLQELGLQSVVNEPRNIDRGVDIAVWSDNLSNIIGNPILIEVKAGLLSRDRLADAERQLMVYLQNTDAKAGLLLYLDKNGRRFYDDLLRNPQIFLYDIEDFMRAVLASSFDKVILERRNQIVHGGI